MRSEQSNDSLLDLAADAADFRASTIEYADTAGKDEASDGSAQSVVDLVSSFQECDLERHDSLDTINSIFQNMMEENQDDSLEQGHFVDECVPDQSRSVSSKRLLPGMLSPPRLTPLRSVRPDQKYFLR